MKDLLAMGALLLAAYLVGRLASRASRARAVEARRLGRIEQRIADLEATLAEAVADAGPGFPQIDPEPPTLDKRYAAFHYEALASQADYERKLAALERRLTSISLERHASRAVRCGNRPGATTGDRRHG